jgi:hypothetical protein
MSSYLNSRGKIGEKLAEEYCQQNKIPYFPADANYQQRGIDIIYAENDTIKFCDVKYSFELYLCNTFIKSAKPKILIRHPFRLSNEATDIWIFDKFTKNTLYKGNLREYLCSKYFCSETALELCKKYLDKIDGYEIPITCDKSIYFYFNTLKKEISKYFKSSVYLNHFETPKQYSLRMITYEERRLVEKTGYRFNQ